MGFRLNVTGGADQIALDEKSIKNVVFDSESPADSNARATDFGVSMKIWGKMIYKLGGEGSDGTIELSSGLSCRQRRRTAIVMLLWR